MVYAHDLEDYDRAWLDLCDLCRGNASLQNFLEYFSANWHCNRKHWALFSSQRSAFNGRVHQQSFRGNKFLIEARDRKKQGPNLCGEKLIALENRQNDKRIRMNSYSRSSIFLPTNVTSKFEYEMILQANNFLSSVSIVKVLEQAKLMNSVKEKLCMDMGQSECPRISGKGHFFKSNMLPCRHLLRVKMLNNVQPIISKDMVGGRNIVKSIKGESKIIPYHEQHVNVSIFKKLSTQNSQCVVPIESLDSSNIEELDEILEKSLIHEVRSESQAKRKIAPNFIPKKRQRLDSQGNNVSNYVKQLNDTLKPLGLVSSWEESTYKILDEHSTDLVSDTIVHSAQVLLKTQFPSIRGLENPVNSETVGFKPIDPLRPFLQIVHDQCHWVLFYKHTQKW